MRKGFVPILTIHNPVMNCGVVNVTMNNYAGFVTPKVKFLMSPNNFRAKICIQMPFGGMRIGSGK
jgi:hypothetical protein